MSTQDSFSAASLEIDATKEIDRIAREMRRRVSRELRARGGVVGLSGGIDSSVVAALSAQAFGPDKTLGILMPERESSPESLELGQRVAAAIGIATVVEDLTDVLDAYGCYRRRDEMIRSVIPEYGDGYTCKIVLPRVLENKGYRHYHVVVKSPDGSEREELLPPRAYRGIVAATNFKQRARKTMEYYHADRLGYAVMGTPNRLEYDQGFFVKNGDGSADAKPIAHLYKTQVYQLAESLGIPADIRERPPTTDTYSMPQSQEEFFFSLPYDKMDLCLYAFNAQIAPAETAKIVELTAAQVELVYTDIAAKRKATHPLHLPPLLVDPVLEIKH